MAVARENAVSCAAVLLILGGLGGGLWGNVAVLVVLSAAQIWLLLSHDMRVHVRIARPRHSSVL